MPHGNALLNSRLLLAEAGVEDGMHIADFGVGTTGHIVLPASRIVGERGRVYAVDVMKKHLQMLEGLCDVHGVCNIFPIWGDYERKGGVSIPDQQLDAVFLINGLPSLKGRPEFTHEVRRVLKPEGRLVIVDWKKHVRHPVAPSAQRRFSLHEAEYMLTKLGFEKARDFPAGITHWGLTLHPLS